MTNYLIAIAMKEEAQDLFEDESVLFTGLGKINASYALTKEIARLTVLGQKPDLVLNFGTAGSFTFKTHDVIECTSFVQRDMDVTALGLDAGVTPFDPLPSRLDFKNRFSWLKKGICGTGDRFETSQPLVACDIVDMEAYAFAKVCALEQIDFACVKYVTDGSDHTAANDWKANLPKAAAAFREAFDRLKALR